MDVIGLSGSIPFVWCEILTYSGTDTDTIAAVYSFNMYFSLVFELGVVASIFTLLCTLLARS
jgi:hypothetical protein